MIDTNALMGDQSKGGSLLDFAFSLPPIGLAYSGMRNFANMYSDDPDVRRGTMVGTMMGVDPSVGDKGLLGGFGGGTGYYGGNASGGLGGGGIFGGLFDTTPTEMAYAELNFEGGDTGGGSTDSGGGWTAADEQSYADEVGVADF